MRQGADSSRPGIVSCLRYEICVVLLRLPYAVCYTQPGVFIVVPQPLLRINPVSLA